MTNAEILERAIQKAIDGGWDVFGHFVDGNVDSWELLETREGPYLSLYTDLSDVEGGRSEIARWHIYELILNHGFAKALWGEQIVQSGLKDGDAHLFSTFAWKTHLVKMVIADDPIKYLGEHLNV